MAFTRAVPIERITRRPGVSVSGIEPHLIEKLEQNLFMILSLFQILLPFFLQVLVNRALNGRFVDLYPPFSVSNAW